MPNCRIPRWVRFHLWIQLWGFIWKCPLCGKGALSNDKPGMWS